MNDDKTEELNNYQLVTFILVFLQIRNTVEWNEFHNLAREDNLSEQKKAELESELTKRVAKLTTVIDTNTVLYRTRPIERDLFEKIAREAPIGEFEKKDIQQLLNMFDISILKMIAEQDLSKIEDTELKVYANKVINGDFRGYPAEESLSPPKEKVTAGRANKEKEPVLYVAFDKATCVYESRPIIGQHISIAEIKSNSELRMFDFRKAKKSINKNGLRMLTMEAEINTAFSKPNP